MATAKPPPCRSYPQAEEFIERDLPHARDAAEMIELFEKSALKA